MKAHIRLRQFGLGAFFAWIVYSLWSVVDTNRMPLNTVSPSLHGIERQLFGVVVPLVVLGVIDAGLWFTVLYRRSTGMAGAMLPWVALLASVLATFAFVTLRTAE